MIYGLSALAYLAGSERMYTCVPKVHARLLEIENCSVCGALVLGSEFHARVYGQRGGQDIVCLPCCRWAAGLIPGWPWTEIPA